MSFYNYGRKIVNKYPRIQGVMVKVYNAIFLNSIKIKGKKNRIKKSKAFIKKCKITIIGDNNFVDLGDTSYFNNTEITIYGNNNIIVFGEKTYMSRGNIYIEDNNNTLRVGKRNTFAGNIHLALTEGKKITIGDKCLFSSDIVFRTGDSHSILDSRGNRTNYGKDIIINNHVWVTQKVTILKGVEVSENSVIATGSILTKKFKEKNVLIAGNPAKIIKPNINWCNERI